MAEKKKRDGLVSVLNVGNGIVSFCSAVLAAILILYSGYVLYDSFAVEISAFSANSDLLKYKPSVLSEGPEGEEEPSLAEISENYRAWITVDGTVIDYPVMQGPDDLYYASHDVYGNSSLTGAIYLAANNKDDFSDSYNLLYGHHMDNSAMFGSLDLFKDEEYFNNHRKAALVTADGKLYEVKFFAVATTDAYERQIYTVGNRSEEVRAFLTGDRSGDAGLGTKVLIYDDNIGKIADRIVALSTCASADTNGRLVVFGRMTQTILPPVTDKPEETTPTPNPTATPTPTPTKGSSGGSGSATTPTPTPTATAGPVTLTVKFISGDGEAFPVQTLIYMPGDHYYVVSPQYPGYDAETEILEGTIQEDMTVVIRYTPKYYRLTIRYLFADGREAAETYSGAVKTGGTYDVASPEVEGYRAERMRISGMNSGRDEQYTVVYIPEGESVRLFTIDDYETPTFLETTYVQIGICYE